MIRKFFLVDDDKDDTELFADALSEIDSSIEFKTTWHISELSACKFETVAEANFANLILRGEI